MDTTAEERTKNPVPWVTLILILGNLVASLATTLSPEVVLQFAFDPRRPTLLAALSSLFLHANLIHLLGNLVFLAAVGPKVESVAGYARYGLIYFLGGLAGVLAHLAVMASMNGTTLLLGASGSIASCVGYCAIRFMNRKVPLAPKLSVSVGTVTLIWLLLQATGFFVKFGSTFGGSAFWTHLAGFGTGMLLSILFKAPEHAKIQFGHEVLEQMGDRSPGALLRAAEQHLARHPDDPHALRQLSAAQHAMGDTEHEAATLIRLFDLSPPSEQIGILRELVDTQHLRLLPAVRRLKLATAYQQAAPELARLLLTSVSEDPEAAEHRPDALLALAELSETSEKEALLHELLTRYALHPATALARAKGLLQ